MPKSGRSHRFGLAEGSHDGSLSRSNGSKVNLTGSFKAPPTAKSPNKLQSLFSPFNKQAQDQSNQLIDLLNQYTATGPPALPNHIARGRPYFDPASLGLEEHWTDIVRDHTALTKAQREQQEAIWELLSTEVEYIRKLRVIIDLFYSCLVNLQSNHILRHIETDKIFNNICDVFYSTTHFWNIHLSQVLRNSRESRAPLDPCLLKSGFQVFDRIFEPYVKYCLDQDQSRRYIKSNVKSDESFRLFVNWAESQSQCNRLSLNDLLVRPFQRLTKYGLLLSALKKPLLKMEVTNGIEQQKKDIVKMVEQVESFVVHVNRLMRQRQDHLLISSMMSRIDSYDVVDVPSDECSKVVDQFCRLDLMTPLPGCAMHETRNLLFEGSLKLKDTYTKMDVYCFLFTDMILITKPTAKRGDKVKVIKPPMRLDKIIVQSMRDVASFMLLYLNEYSMAQAVYTFHGDSKQWLARVTKAQRDYTAKKLSSPIRTIDAQSRFDTPSNIHKKLFETTSLNLEKKSLSSERRFDEDSISSHPSYHYQHHPPPFSYSHSSEKLVHELPTPSYHPHHSYTSSLSSVMPQFRSQLSVPSMLGASLYDSRKTNKSSFSSISSVTDAPIPEDVETPDKQKPKKRLMKISDSDDNIADSNTEENLKDVKKISILSTSSIDLSSLKSSYNDLNQLKGDDEEDKGEVMMKGISGKEQSFKGRVHKRNISDPIIMRTCQSVNDLSINLEASDASDIEVKTKWIQDDLVVSVVSSDPGFSGQTDVISAAEFDKLFAHNHSRSETSLTNIEQKRYKRINFRHKPFKEKIKLGGNSLMNAKEDKSENINESKNEIPPHESTNIHAHNKSIPRSSTSDSNDEFFETPKDSTEETPSDTKDILQKTFDKLIEKTSESIQNDKKDSKKISAVIISISNEGSVGKSSQSTTPPDDEFHLCFSPEDYNKSQSPPVTPDGKNGTRKAPRHSVIVVEAASQTSIDLLISGYWAATSGINDTIGGSFNTQYRTVSLPNIFDVLPSACCALNSLIERNNETNLSLIETS